MKSQHAGSLFGTLIIAASSFALLNLIGSEVPYLNGQAAYAVTSQTLERSCFSDNSIPQSIQIARRFRSVSR